VIEVVEVAVGVNVVTAPGTPAIIKLVAERTLAEPSELVAVIL
jgi:hypothetical protein